MLFSAQSYDLICRVAAYETRLIFSVVQKAVYMSDNTDNAKQMPHQKDLDSIEQKHFRTLMRFMDEYASGNGPRPTKRCYRAWIAAMMTKSVLAHFRAKPKYRPILLVVASTAAPDTQSPLPYDNPVEWGTVLTAASIAAALSLLFIQRSR